MPSSPRPQPQAPRENGVLHSCPYYTSSSLSDNRDEKLRKSYTAKKMLTGLVTKAEKAQIAQSLSFPCAEDASQITFSYCTGLYLL